MSTDEGIERGRSAAQRQAWDEAFTTLAAADRITPLDPDDLELLAVAGYLSGRDEESVGAWTRAYRGHVAADDLCRAARCAFWVGLTLMMRGEMAPSNGWFARGQRLLDEGGPDDCAERALFLIPISIENLMAGDPRAVLESSTRTVTIGDRFGDCDASTIGRLGRGQALIMLGELQGGMAELDEAMVAVTSGDVSPIAAGIVYCAVIETCQEALDVRRVREWTAAMTRWCEPQPDLVPYRGQCLVHRSQVMQLHGDWSDAMGEVNRACDRLSRPPPHPALGLAYYQHAELLRLRGLVDDAAEAYRKASVHGYQPQPGLALLRLARGDAPAADAAIRRAVDEAHDELSGSKLRACLVEIALAAGDVDSAREAAGALARAAATIAAPALSAMAATATGRVALADGAPSEALGALRAAWSTWHDLEAPYEAARVRVLIAEACRGLGDDDGSALELDAARRVFEHLGAAPDLAALDRSQAAPDRVGGLTVRELEILGLIATGMTNRAIAAELVISEKTVARHVSNIFRKLGLSSRSAATAYAYQHAVV